MPIDEETQATLRALWQVGQDHGRPPSPVPEADPWEVDDPVDGPQPVVTAVLGGVPDVVVHLHRDRQDVVAVEGCVDLEVPRRDVVAVADAVPAGRARRRARVRGVLGNGVAALLGSPVPSDVEVAVDGRVHSGQVLVAPPISAWVLSLPAAED